MPLPPRSRTRGLTLVEVLASLALLGGLLGSAVLTKGRLARQWSAAQQRAVAVERLDHLLETWWAQGDIPIHGSGDLVAVNGEIPHHNDATLRWTTQPHPLDRSELTALGITSIAVRAWTDTAHEPVLLAEVELLGYMPPPETAPGPLDSEAFNLLGASLRRLPP